MIAIGVALVVRTLAAGGGGLALGIVLGVLFVAAGGGAARTCRRAQRARHRRTRRTLSAPRAVRARLHASVSSVYFALGVVAQRALGLTPLVFLVAGVFFALASMTYVEGASLHQERGGSSRVRALRLQRAGRASSPAGRSCSTT